MVLLSLLVPEVILLIGFLFVLAEARKNFFIPAAAAAYSVYFLFTQVDHTNRYAYLLTGMGILLMCAAGYSFYLSYSNNRG